MTFLFPNVPRGSTGLGNIPKKKIIFFDAFHNYDGGLQLALLQFVKSERDNTVNKSKRPVDALALKAYITHLLTT